MPCRMPCVAKTSRRLHGANARSSESGWRHERNELNMNEADELAALRAENARLAALLDAHGVAWRWWPEPVLQPAAEPSRLTTEEKVALFRSLFRGRTDVFPIRWESKSTGKSGYAPACANEWRAGVCEKPRIKCGDCAHRL